MLNWLSGQGLIAKAFWLDHIVLLGKTFEKMGGQLWEFRHTWISNHCQFPILPKILYQTQCITNTSCTRSKLSLIPDHLNGGECFRNQFECILSDGLTSYQWAPSGEKCTFASSTCLSAVWLNEHLFFITPSTILQGKILWSSALYWGPQEVCSET